MRKSKSNGDSVRVGIAIVERILANPDDFTPLKKRERDGLISLQRLAALLLAEKDGLPQEAASAILRDPISLHFGDGVVQTLEVVKRR